MTWKPTIKLWFKECKPQQWFKKTAVFDRKVQKRFHNIYWQVVRGETAKWRKSAKGRLAEVIALDQFERNIFRGKSQAFLFDPLARSCAGRHPCPSG